MKIALKTYPLFFIWTLFIGLFSTFIFIHENKVNSSLAVIKKEGVGLSIKFFLYGKENQTNIIFLKKC